jgi:hypothetical protein
MISSGEPLSIGLSQGAQYKSYKNDKIKFTQPSVRLMSDSNDLALTQVNSSTTSSIFTNISEFLFGNKRNMQRQESGLDQNFKSASCYEGFEGMLGPTDANTTNIQDADTMIKLEDKFNRSMSDYATSHKILMDKTQNYVLSKSSSNERNKNIYAVTGQPSDAINQKWKGCYAGGKGLIYQEDMGNNATLSACKTRASDLGYSNFALSNNTNANIDSINTSKCYVGNSGDSDSESAANKTMVSYAFTQNKNATMGGLLKNGQIGTFNNSINNDLVVDLPGVPGCDASVGGMINTKNSVASYGANCNDQKKPKTIKEQLSELCPPNKTNPNIIESGIPGINYNYDTYLFGPCNAAGTCDSTIPDDISKELLAGIKANKSCRYNRFTDGNYLYNNGSKIKEGNSFYDPNTPEGWSKTDCKKYWYDTGAPHMQYGCMQNLWQEAGCTTIMNDVDKTLREKFYSLNTTDINKSMKVYATATDDDHRTKCYGADKSKWPTPPPPPPPTPVNCNKYTNDDVNIPYNCLQEKWNDFGCTTDIKEALGTYYDTLPPSEQQRFGKRDTFVQNTLNSRSINQYKKDTDNIHKFATDIFINPYIDFTTKNQAVTTSWNVIKQCYNKDRTKWPKPYQFPYPP